MHSWNKWLLFSMLQLCFRKQFKEKRHWREGIKAKRRLCQLLFLVSPQSSSILRASFETISYPIPISACVAEIRREYTKPAALSAVSCFPFFSVTIPSGFGDLSSKIDFNSLGIKHSVLTLPSSCQSQKERNVVSKDFNIIPSEWLDGVLCCLNLS